MQALELAVSFRQVWYMEKITPTGPLCLIMRKDPGRKRQRIFRYLNHFIFCLAPRFVGVSLIKLEGTGDGGRDKAGRIVLRL
jgi:hypothetical protein